MAKRKQADGQRYIEAANGFGWTIGRGASVLAVQPQLYTTVIFGVAYRLEKFRGPSGDHGWYLYSSRPAHFTGEYCDRTLLPAIDEASRMVVEADLRGEGYEKET